MVGWKQLWEDKGRPYDGDLDDFDGNFNCVALELTLTDLEQLEAEIANKTLPASQGFFWGMTLLNGKRKKGNLTMITIIIIEKMICSLLRCFINSKR